MITYQGEVLINRPADQVFTFMADLENAPKWQSEVTDSTVISEGPIRVGTKFREVVRVLGRPVEAICEMTEYEPPRKMAYKTDSSGAIQYEGQFALDPTQDGTRLISKSNTSLKGLWRLVEPIFAGEIKRAGDKELKRLKAVLESQG